MAKLTLTDPTAGYNSTTVIAANNALVEAALENTVSRDGTAPNAMSAALDLNSNKINNVADGTSNQDAVTLAQLNAASVVATTAAATAVTLADAGGNYTATTAEAAFAELASTATGEGASIIGLEDAAGNVAATNVEDAIAEIYTDSAATAAALAATTNGNGASLVGVEDSAGNFTGTDVEAVLAELYTETGSFTVNFDTSTFTIADSHTWYWVREGQHVKAFYTSSVSGTSNATNFLSVTAQVPAALRPETTQKTVVEIQDNGTREIGFVSVLATGQIQVSRVSGAAFTASGTKALTGTNFVISWFLGDHLAF